MSDVLRTGSWLYDDSVRGSVSILKVKGDRANIVDGDYEEPGHPPTDADGYYYIAKFSLPSLPPKNNGSTSGGHATLEEAVQYAEEKIPGPINWDSI